MSSYLIFQGIQSRILHPGPRWKKSPELPNKASSGHPILATYGYKDRKLPLGKQTFNWWPVVSQLYISRWAVFGILFCSSQQSVDVLCVWNLLNKAIIKKKWYPPNNSKIKIQPNPIHRFHIEKHAHSKNEWFREACLQRTLAGNMHCVYFYSSSLWSVQYKCKKVLKYIQKYAKGISNYSKLLIFSFKWFDICVYISAFTNMREWDAISVKCWTLFLSYFLDILSQFLKNWSFKKFWEFSFYFPQVTWEMFRWIFTGRQFCLG